MPQPTNEPTTSTIALARELGVSYRMLNYWLRTNYTHRTGLGVGSGNRVELYPEEVAGIRAIAAEHNRIERAKARLRDGRVYLEAVQDWLLRHQDTTDSGESISHDTARSPGRDPETGVWYAETATESDISSEIDQKDVK